MRKGVFRRIFILYAVFFSLTILFSGLYISSVVRNHYIDNLKKNLATQITLISGNIPFGGADIDALCRQLKQQTGARVTVILNEGKVIGDSETDSSLMENHIHRPEIEQAALLGAGSSSGRPQGC